MSQPQNFSNHRAMPPASYLAAGLVLLVFAGRCIWRAATDPSFDALLLALVALALLIVWNASRSRAMVVQDRVTSVVPGMPEAALRASGADAVVPLNELASVIAAQVGALARRPALRESA